MSSSTSSLWIKEMIVEWTNIWVSLCSGKTPWFEVIYVLHYLIFFYEFLIEKMSIVPLGESKEHLTRKKDECQSTDSPQSRSSGRMTVEGKRCGEDNTLDNARPYKIQNQGDGPSQVSKEFQGKSLPTKDGSRPQPSLWSDASFDAIKFIKSYLPFPKDFNTNYIGIHDKSTLELSRMDENHFLRGLLVEWVQREKYTQAFGENPSL